MITKGLNKVQIIGHLGSDPETRVLDNGTTLTIISVATSEVWTDKNTGELRESTEWHRITAFGKLAEIMGKYLTKGSQVYTEGKLKTRKWQDQNGQDRYSTDILADRLQMLDRKRVEQASATQGGIDGAKPNLTNSDTSVVSNEQSKTDIPNIPNPEMNIEIALDMNNYYNPETDGVPF